MSLKELDERVRRSSRGSGPNGRGADGDLGGARAARRGRFRGARRLAREASQELPRLAASRGPARDEGKWDGPRGASRRSRRCIRNTSGRRTPTCCWPPVYRSSPTPPPSARRSRSWPRATAAPARPTSGCWSSTRPPRTGTAVASDARRLLAVNPLIPAPYRQLARASEQLGEPDEALTAYRAVALLDDSDPAEVHYRLARLLQQARASATRPAARSSSRSRRPRGSWTPTGSCSSWSNPRLARRTRPSDPDPEALTHETATMRSLLVIPLLVAIVSGAGRGPVRAGGGRRRRHGRCPRTAPACRTGRSTSDSSTTSSRSSASNTTRAAAAMRRWRRGGGGGGGGFRGGWGGGWATDWPDSDLNFSFRLQQLTSLKVNPDPITPAADRPASSSTIRSST